MKTQVHRSILLSLFLFVFVAFPLYSGVVLSEKKSFQPPIFHEESIMVVPTGAPMRLKIPQIGVDASIEYMGVTETGVMEVPDTSYQVGWFKLGPQPGERGSAVIAGHFDGINGVAGVFMNLHKLREGDTIYVEDTNGSSQAFVVRETRIFDPGYADTVFSASSSAHLNLITCDGVWNGAQKSYDKRLVVFTNLVQ